MNKLWYIFPIFIATVAVGATLDNTPLLTGPLRSTDKLPAGRVGQATANTINVGQVADYTQGQISSAGGKVTTAQKALWTAKQDALAGDVAGHYHTSDRNRSNHTGTQASSTITGNFAQSRTHDSVDTDTATTSLHHTLGTGANQAAAGNDGRFPNTTQKSYLTEMESGVLTSQVLVNDLTSGGTQKALSAEQGKNLKAIHDNYSTAQAAKDAAQDSNINARLATSTAASTYKTQTAFNSYSAAQHAKRIAHNSADDHPQYHNDTRGDARYPLKSVFDGYTSNAAPIPSKTVYLSKEGIPANGSDVSASIQALIDNTAVGDSLTIIADSGIYGVGATLVLDPTKRIDIIGQGKNIAVNKGTVFKALNPMRNVFFSNVLNISGAAARNHFSRFVDFQIDGDLKAEIGMSIGYMEGARIDIKITDCTESGFAFSHPANWDSTVTYPKYAYVQDDGAMYQSLQDGNLNHALSDGSWWTLKETRTVPAAGVHMDDIAAWTYSFTMQGTAINMDNKTTNLPLFGIHNYTNGTDNGIEGVEIGDTSIAGIYDESSYAKISKNYFVNHRLYDIWASGYRDAMTSILNNELDICNYTMTSGSAKIRIDVNGVDVSHNYLGGPGSGNAYISLPASVIDTVITNNRFNGAGNPIVFVSGTYGTGHSVHSNTYVTCTDPGAVINGLAASGASGSDGYVQFATSSAFDSDSLFKWVKADHRLLLGAASEFDSSAYRLSVNGPSMFGMDDGSPSISIRNSQSTEPRYPSLSIVNYNGGLAGNPLVDMQNLGGSRATPAPTDTTVALFEFRATGRGSTANKIGGKILGLTTGAFTDADQPFKWTFQAGGPGSNGTPADVFSIDSTGVTVASGLKYYGDGSSLTGTGGMQYSAIVSYGDGQNPSVSDFGKVVIFTAGTAHTVPQLISTGSTYTTKPARTLLVNNTSSDMTIDSASAGDYFNINGTRSNSAWTLGAYMAAVIAPLDSTTGVYQVENIASSASGTSISTDDTSVAITDSSDGYISFTEDNTEQMRLTGGNLIVGGTVPLSKLHASNTSTAGVRGIISEQINDGAEGSLISLYKKRTTTPFTVQNADVIGDINFSGYDGDEYYRGGIIRYKVNGTPANNSIPGDMLFYTSLALRATLPVDGGFRIATATEQTCDEAHRGTINYVAGGAGVADTLKVCRKDASNNYAWVALY